MSTDNPRSLVFALFAVLAACGGSSIKPAEQPSTQANVQPIASAAPSAAPAASAALAASAAPAASTAPGASASAATLSGRTLTLSYGGNTYRLSDSSVVLSSPREASLQFNQPMSVGYNQIWLMVTHIKKGAPAKVHGLGMDGAFVQLAKSTEDVHNISNSCKSHGTVTFGGALKVGSKAKGTVDVTITCSSEGERGPLAAAVASLGGPLVIRGSFEGVPVVK